MNRLCQLLRSSMYGVYRPFTARFAEIHMSDSGVYQAECNLWRLILPLRKRLQSIVDWKHVSSNEFVFIVENENQIDCHAFHRAV
jgi:hypothetical protein